MAHSPDKCNDKRAQCVIGSFWTCPTCDAEPVVRTPSTGKRIHYGADWQLDWNQQEWVDTEKTPVMYGSPLTDAWSDALKRAFPAARLAELNKQIEDAQEAMSKPRVTVDKDAGVITYHYETK